MENKELTIRHDLADVTFKEIDNEGDVEVIAGNMVAYLSKGDCVELIGFLVKEVTK
tara:strand:+ start:494 stop:661 length:168 start_codon:yes stop_codon:yes gene_type:complete